MHLKGFVKSAWSGVALLIALICSAWSDNLPAIPSPKGFIESASVVPALKDQALLGHPLGTRVIGVYLLPDELANIMRGGAQSMTIFCRAYVKDEFRSQEQAKAFFRGMVANARREQSKRFDPTDPDVSRIIQQYVDATKQRQGVSVNIIGASFLGSILDIEDTYAMTAIISLAAQTGQGQVLVPVNSTVAWVRLGNQILELSAAAQFEGSQSIEKANNILTEWLKVLPR